MKLLTRLLLLVVAVIPAAAGCAVGSESTDTSADNQGPGSEPTLENDVENVMIGRSAAALNEAPGGGGYGGECSEAHATCMDGCQQYNTRWDAIKTLVWGSSNYTRCRDKCDLAYHVCKGGMSAGSGLL
jgi:hypothetical protein